MFDTPLKGKLMKRFIAAVSFSLLAAPALADVGLPYDQNLIDRQLPNIEFPAVEANVADERAPYEPLDIDRAVPQFPDKAGDSKTTSEAAPGSESIWEHDD